MGALCKTEVNSECIFSFAVTICDSLVPEFERYWNKKLFLKGVFSFGVPLDNMNLSIDFGLKFWLLLKMENLEKESLKNLEFKVEFWI